MKHSPHVSVSLGNPLIRTRHIGCVRCLLLLATLLLCAACERTPTAENKPVIVILNPNPNLQEVVDGFKEGLRERGYSPTYRTPEIPGPQANVKQIVADSKEDADLFLTATTEVTIAAKEDLEGENIPIVFAPIYDPVRAGVVGSLVRHGGNITGVKIAGSNAKALDWLLNVNPSIRRIFVPVNRIDAISAAVLSLDDLQRAADILGVSLVTKDVRSRTDLAEALSHLPEGTDALWLLHSFFLVPNVGLFVESAIRNHIPLASGTSQYKDGVMLTYGQYYYQTGRQASRLADLILKGTPASSLPIETSDFFLSVNLRTAKAAGVTIPYDVLQQADNVLR